MFRTGSNHYKTLREYIETLPVINTHEHYAGTTKPVDDVINFVAGYHRTDLVSAAFGMEKEVQAALSDTTLSFDYRYELFENSYKKSNKTAYARAILAGLKECWGIEEITKQSLLQLQAKLKTRNEQFYEKYMQKYKIKACIVDILDVKRFKNIIQGKDKEYTKYCKFALTLPAFHSINTSLNIYNNVEEFVDRKITCLDDYLEGFENMLKKAVDFGIVCFKDQSAYHRKIDYGNPPKADAETIFNQIINSPRNVFSTDQVRPLDDWLFHHFMRLAAKYKLSIQLHTGHMAGYRGDVRQANAAHLIPLMELHTDVKFDLFHGSWPYMDEYLFIGKNYPNAYLDLCWVHIIDPIYCVELMKRALVTMPHTKMMVFGGDTFYIELTVGFLLAARDNVACALSEMIDSGWIDLLEAKQIAADWFFNNPNEFFNLGFARLNVEV